MGYVEQYIIRLLVRDSSVHNKLIKKDIVDGVRELMRSDLYAEVDLPNRSTIERHLDAMSIDVTGEENYELKKRKSAEVLCEANKNGTHKKYWIENLLSDYELRYILDSVLYTKLLSTDQAKNLCSRIINLSGERFKKYTSYINNMNRQLYIGEENILQNVEIIQEAIIQQRKVKFMLNVYDWVYDSKKKRNSVKLIPYWNSPKVISPYDIIMSNGKYYLLGENTKKEEDISFKMYRIDLMTDVKITRAIASSKREEYIEAGNDLYKYRVENPYMYGGELRTITIRVDMKQFTQIVDWFGDNFRVVGESAENIFIDIELRVNEDAFLFWVLQYGLCIEVIRPIEYRQRVRNVLEEIVKKYN